MKDTLFVLETADHRFVCFEQVGNTELDAFPIEEYFNANKFDSEEEVNTFVELLNTGKTTNTAIKPNWNIHIDQSLIPVKKRTIYTELLEHDEK